MPHEIDFPRIASAVPRLTKPSYLTNLINNLSTFLSLFLLPSFLPPTHPPQALVQKGIQETERALGSDGPWFDSVSVTKQLAR